MTCLLTEEEREQKRLSSYIHDTVIQDLGLIIFMMKDLSNQIKAPDLLTKLDANKMPLLLCWGEEDPWIRPQAADKIQALYPKAIRASIDAGHCPHDEAPDAVNAAIRDFMENTVVAKAD